MTGHDAPPPFPAGSDAPLAFPVGSDAPRPFPTGAGVPRRFPAGRLGARLRERRGFGLRARLTMLYGGLFFGAGALLLWVTYALTARAMEQRIVARLSASQPIGREPMPRQNQMFVYVADKLAQQVETGTADVLAELMRNSAIGLVVIGVLATLFGWIMTDRALRPLQRVTRTAERLSESTLHERIALEGPSDHVKRLADTFDAMLDRLQRAFDTQRRFVTNASHELRTPIAVNRTLIEVALEEPDASDDLHSLGRALLGVNARHERLIEGLLLLARSENELVTRRPVDMEHVAESVLEQLDAKAERRDITLRAELSPASASGDALLLERCVFNLVENAIKYNTRGGHVEVRLAAGEELTLVVENTGPLIPAHEAGDLFEPFRRLHDRVGSAQGAGLGLSIVRAIAVVHGGTVTAVPRAGGGLSVTVRLPRARDAGAQPVGPAEVAGRPGR
ncbi:Signal transduction histidine kinase [Streptosporangium subroseum]|uniref:histidine kinase n=1 Tax=Streptosporangium subroseum TaxID=106412 RepID=A0A239HST0_9ACTN|nr:HAMP domain-containing sensor histidine kinase [Streptosporangium subroseum]SNS84350.1 Signal transduction histidine kinase [Streptosporangium subroseum]